MDWLLILFVVSVSLYMLISYYSIKSLTKRVDFLMLAVVSGVLGDQASGDGEKDFDAIVDKMDASFGKKEE